MLTIPFQPPKSWKKRKGQQQWAIWVVKKLATDSQSLRMRGYVTTRLLMPQACDGQQAIHMPKPRTSFSKGCWLSWGWFPFRLPGTPFPLAVLGRILRPNYPRRKTRFSRRPLGNTHHGSLQITSLRGCVTSSKQLTLTVDSHWRGCEQQRAGELGRGGRRVGGAERGGRGDDGAPDTAGARRGGAVATSPSQPRTRRLLPSSGPRSSRPPPPGPRSCRLATARTSPHHTQPAAISSCQPASWNSRDLFLCSPLSYFLHPVFSQLVFLYPEPQCFFLFLLRISIDLKWLVFLTFVRFSPEDWKGGCIFSPSVALEDLNP